MTASSSPGDRPPATEPPIPVAPPSAAALRLSALSRLVGSRGAQGGRASTAEALVVLHTLASSPDTAGQALTLLHELQVHQVELDLQDEEFHLSRAELEGSLHRQSQRYEQLPVACFTVDSAGMLCEINALGVAYLGFGRSALLGCALGLFLLPEGALALRDALARACAGERLRIGPLDLKVPVGEPRRVIATLGPDPAGGRALVVFTDFA